MKVYVQSDLEGVAGVIASFDAGADEVVVNDSRGSGYNTPHSLYELNCGEDYFGEPTMAAALAGHHGVPTVCVSGDDTVTIDDAFLELQRRMPWTKFPVELPGGFQYP